ncbi:MAG: CBS domain-containing protein [Euzebyaceae bacterium]|jgi:CBS domain-containing protein|nr:CBS domain-containing protein [Euzebyaceae bacterium]MDQ3708992.1 CBS domain-containing protein [Actinomycetota bacterium]
MPRDLAVTEVMTTPVTTLTADTTIEEAASLLVEADIGGAPVVDGSGRLIGLLDDSDLVLSEARLHAPTTIEILGAYIPLPGERRRFQDELRQALGRTVGEVMEDDPPAVQPDATVEDVATLLHDRAVSRVAVVDAERQVVGIVSRGDLVRALRRAQE